MFRRLLTVMTAAALASGAPALAAVHPAAAATPAGCDGAAFVWTGAGNGTWHDPADWTLDGIVPARTPGTGDDVSIPASAKVTIDTATTACSVTLGTGATIDLGGQILTISTGIRASFAAAPKSVFADGAKLISSQPHGVLLVTSFGVLELDGTLTISKPANLLLSSAAPATPGAITDTREWSAAGHSAVLAGSGTFNWQDGSVQGHVTLKDPLVVSVSRKSWKYLSTEAGVGKAHPTLLLNKSTRFTLSAGSIESQDRYSGFENAGAVLQTAGTFYATSSANPAVVNDRGATWTYKETAAAPLAARAFTNKGKLVIGVGSVFYPTTFTQSSTGSVQLTLAGLSSTRFSRLGADKGKLAGTLKLVSANSYKPRVPTTVVNVAYFNKSLSGKFTKVASTTHQSRRTWVSSYSGRFLSAVLKAG
jgi:hypothetical protein